MKSKTGEDKVLLRKKLADLDREWDKACSVSVDRQDKLENAYQELAEFRYSCVHIIVWLIFMYRMGGKFHG